MVNENKNNVTDSIHRVLARKYRPLNFTKLVGQNNLIKTLSGSIERGRLAHAYILTGVRGVGKTSTARIIAISDDFSGFVQLNNFAIILAVDVLPTPLTPVSM